MLGRCFLAGLSATFAVLSVGSGCLLDDYKTPEDIGAGGSGSGIGATAAASGGGECGTAPGDMPSDCFKSICDEQNKPKKVLDPSDVPPSSGCKVWGCTADGDLIAGDDNTKCDKGTCENGVCVVPSTCEMNPKCDTKNPCLKSGNCKEGHCQFDNEPANKDCDKDHDGVNDGVCNGFGVCSTACNGLGDCPAGWSCKSSVCIPGP